MNTKARRHYLTDLTEGQWALIEPLLPEAKMVLANRVVPPVFGAVTVMMCFMVMLTTTLRARRFKASDIEHLAEKIEDVGKSERRELAQLLDYGFTNPGNMSLNPCSTSSANRLTLSIGSSHLTFFGVL